MPLEQGGRRCKVNGRQSQIQVQAMESTCALLVWSSICLAAALLLLGHSRRKATAGSGQLPPGPRGWPVFGNMFDMGPMPHHTLASLQPKYGPLIFLRLGTVKTVAVSSVVAATEMFKNHDLSFSDRNIIEALRACSYNQGAVSMVQLGPYWRMLRRLYTTQLFTLKRVNEGAPLRRKCVDDMIGWISEEAKETGCIEVARFVFLMTFNLMGNILLSQDLLDPNSVEGREFFHLSTGLVTLAARPNLADFFPFLQWLDPQGIRRKMERDLGRALEIAAGFVKERTRDHRLGEKNKKNDFLDMLMGFEGNREDELDKISDKNLNILIFVHIESLKDIKTFPMSKGYGNGQCPRRQHRKSPTYDPAVPLPLDTAVLVFNDPRFTNRDCTSSLHLVLKNNPLYVGDVKVMAEQSQIQVQAMESTCALLIWSSICLAAALLLLGHSRRKTTAGSGKLPPGPRGWPVFGNMFDMGPMPHHTLTSLKPKYGLLIFLRLGTVKTVVVSSVIAATDMFKNHDLSFSDRNITQALRACSYNQGAVSMVQVGPYWRMLRRLYTTQLFTLKRINEGAPLRRKCVDDMIGWISEEAKQTGCVQVASFVFLMTFNLISGLVGSQVCSRKGVLSPVYGTSDLVGAAKFSRLLPFTTMARSTRYKEEDGAGPRTRFRDRCWLCKGVDSRSPLRRKKQGK
ncbi:hypothetical protein HHK36_016752 [Tetracentron sinense]|uniref:Cytochrome P450 n=1 Tax=Tetracentron sinense TaxID=13715 RepID=A0A834Z112_TETSI|nr:hypothetical protein HHK36_016752 [Tetracentron sinense]